MLTEYEQSGFVFRRDNGTEITASVINPKGSIFRLATNRTYRVRFLIEELLDIGVYYQKFQLQYNRIGDLWENVGLYSSYVKAEYSNLLALRNNTTQQLGNGAFITYNLGASLTGEVPFVPYFDPGGQIELEFSFSIIHEDVRNGDTFRLRVSPLDFSSKFIYTAIPAFTVRKQRKQTRISKAVDIEDYILACQELYEDNELLFLSEVEKEQVRRRHSQYFKNSSYTLLTGQAWGQTPINSINIQISGDWVHYPALIRPCPCDDCDEETIYDCRVAGCTTQCCLDNCY